LRLGEVGARREELTAHVAEMYESGRGLDVVRAAGQSAGAIRDVLPVAEIVQGMIAEAETVLRSAGALIRS
jgi:hypothetical protein